MEFKWVFLPDVSGFFLLRWCLSLSPGLQYWFLSGCSWILQFHRTWSSWLPPCDQPQWLLYYSWRLWYCRWEAPWKEFHWTIDSLYLRPETSLFLNSCQSYLKVIWDFVWWLEMGMILTEKLGNQYPQPSLQPFLHLSPAWMPAFPFDLQLYLTSWWYDKNIVVFYGLFFSRN